MKKTLLFTLLILSVSLFSQLSNTSVSETYAWKVKLSISPQTGADSIVIFVSTDGFLSTTPKDGNYYPRGSWYNDSKVAYNLKNKAQDIEIKGLLANTTYYFTMYSYINIGGSLYDIANKFNLEVKSKGNEIGDYYSSLDTNKDAFLTSLAAILSNHTLAPYNDLTDLVDEVYVKDTFFDDTSRKYVVCDYSNLITVYPVYFDFSFGHSKFSREHTLPKNWMNFQNVPNNDLINFKEGADYHNLSIVQEDVNSLRQDFRFDDIFNSQVQNIGDASYYTVSNYNDPANTFEPKRDYKGNAARCMFYQMVCYNGTENVTWGLKNGLKSFAVNQEQAVLKSWAKEDTVDNFEIARNECIYKLQGSRNLFIDFPEWIDCIDFDDLTLLKTCEGLSVPDTSKPIDTTKPIDTNQNSINNSAQNAWDVWFYNEGNDVFVKFYNSAIEPININLYDLNGKHLYSLAVTANIGLNVIKLDINSYPKGFYILNIDKKSKSKTFKMWKE